MAETFTLDAQPRTVTGKKVIQLRTQGLVPAIIYGSKISPVAVQIPYRPLQVALMKAGGTNLIEVSVDGGTHVVLARDVQRDVIRGDILHVDFLAVDVNAKISTEVPVHVAGESPAEATRVGLLSHNVNTLTVEALPRDLISSIEVDVSGLKAIGDAVHVRDLNLGDKVTVLADPDEVVVRVIPIPQIVEEEETGEGASAEPEVISKGKADEEGEE